MMTEEQETAEVQSHAVGTLQEWFDDYTPPFPDGYQRRVRPMQYTEDGMVASVSSSEDSYAEAVQYRVTVRVERVR